MAMVMKRILHIIRDYDHEYTEFSLAIFKFIFGVWFLLPFDTFSDTNTYRLMGQIAPEEVWGILFLVIGVIQMWGLVDGRHYIIRSWVSLIGVNLWLALSILSLYGNPSSPGFGVTLVFSLSNIVIYLRLREINQYVSQRHTR